MNSGHEPFVITQPSNILFKKNYQRKRKADNTEASKPVIKKCPMSQSNVYKESMG